MAPTRTATAVGTPMASQRQWRGVEGAAASAARLIRSADRSACLASMALNRNTLGNHPLTAI